MKEASASCRASFLFRAFSVFHKSECDKIVRTGKRETMSILFFDIDNTLFSHKTWTIPDSAARALAQAKENGHQLFLSSGRSLAGLDEFLVNPIFDGALSGSGACGSYHGKLLFSHAMKEADVEKAVELGMQYHAGLSMQGLREAWLSEDAMAFFGKDYEAFRRRNNVRLLREYNHEPIYKMDNWFKKGTNVEEMLAQLPDSVHICRILTEFDIGSGCELTAEGVNKGTGVREMMEHLGLPITEAYGFGDSENDLELLKVCGTGVAMGNSTDPVKAAADYVTDDIEEDGILHALEHLGII